MHYLSLKDFSYQLYDNKDIQRELLALQDELGLDVCVLLSLIWLSSRQVVIESTQLKMLLELLQPWRTEITQPLRTLRRQFGQLRGRADLKQVNKDGLEVLYVSLKQLELNAENETLQRIQFFVEQELSSGLAKFENKQYCLEKNLVHYAQVNNLNDQCLQDLIQLLELSQ